MLIEIVNQQLFIFPVLTQCNMKHSSLFILKLHSQGVLLWINFHSIKGAVS